MGDLEHREGRWRLNERDGLLHNMGEWVTILGLVVSSSSKQVLMLEFYVESEART